MGTALVPVVAWAVAKAAGAPGPLRWGLAVVTVLSPVLGRVGQSQSYYATCTFLLALAALPLAVAPAVDLRKARGWVGILGSALLVSQAVRIHPICWVAAAGVPLAALARSASVRETIRALAASTVGIAIVVASTSGSALLGVMRGGLWEQWSPAARGLPMFPIAVSLVAFLASAVVAARWARREIVAVGALVALALLATATSLVASDAAIYRRAYEGMFLAAAIAPIGVLAASSLEGSGGPRARWSQPVHCQAGSLRGGLLACRPRKRWSRTCSSHGAASYRRTQRCTTSAAQDAGCSTCRCTASLRLGLR